MATKEEITLDNIDEMQKSIGSQEIIYVESLNTQKQYYPINIPLFDTLLGYYTEKQLAGMGIIKTDYLEEVS